MTWEQPDEILKQAHRQFSKDIEYPESGSEDRLNMVDHYNNALATWENKALEGICWPELMVTTQNIILGGTGIDILPEDFLTFFRVRPEAPAQLRVGGAYYSEVAAAQGAQFVQEADANSTFWLEAGGLRTYAGASGTIVFPYVKKATRIVTGDEIIPSEIRNKVFLVDFITARLFLDNEDDTLYQQYNNDAIDKLNAMVGNYLASLPASSY